MKRHFIFVATIISLLSCSNYQPKYTIKGTLESKNYDGEWIYLTPAENASRTNIDSVKIKDGRFTFTGDTERVSILRLKPILRLKVQELLVVTEKGIINVKLGKNSSASGTKQNELLQQWKDNTIKSIATTQAYNELKEKGTSPKEIKNIEEERDSITKYTKKLTTDIIHKNRGTTLSKFLSNVTCIK